MSRGKVLRSTPRLLVAALLLQTAGCSGGGVPATEEAARSALASALDGWKAGCTPADMRQKTPEIVVGDADWKQGCRLVAYHIGTGMFDGKNLRVPVTLVLAHPPQGQRKLVVEYIVGTNPAVTIFRDGE